MSPEQARGEKLDARTDLFSFGLVLYEMATGQRAFAGDTQPVLLTAILTQVQTSARQLNPELPPKLDAIIHRALEKDRDARYQSVTEMGADMELIETRKQSKASPSLVDGGPRSHCSLDCWVRFSGLPGPALPPKLRRRFGNSPLIPPKAPWRAGQSPPTENMSLTLI